MIGLSAVMMLSCGLWCSILGASLGRPYGLLVALAGGVVGLLGGLFLGAALGEVEAELTLRAGVAREAGQKLRCSLWIIASGLLWLGLVVSFFYSWRILAYV